MLYILSYIPGSLPLQVKGGGGGRTGLFNSKCVALFCLAYQTTEYRPYFTVDNGAMNFLLALAIVSK